MPKLGMNTSGQGGFVANQGGGGIFGGLIPEKGSAAHNQLIQSLVQSGLQSAGQGSPIVAGLAPILGAITSSKSDARFQEAEAGRNQELSQALLADLAGNPIAQSSLDVLNNPNAPDHLKSIATSRLSQILKPRGGRGGSGGVGPDAYRRPPANTDALLTRILYSALDPSSEGGAAISPAEQARIDSVRTARSRVSTGATDELTALLQGGAPEQTAPAAAPAQSPAALDANDPLGILGLPPA